tara:strand:- start:18 stop:581 length:564 start_codon:yes stop_codon:yes gene_type:complete
MAYEIELIEPGAGTAEQNAFLERVPPINLFKALAHAPEIANAVAQMGGALLYKTGLDAGLREVAILRAAYQAGCDYEVAHHERIALDVGLDEETLAAIRPGQDLSGLSAGMGLACRWADEAVASGRAGQHLVEEAIAMFGKAQTIELAVTVAYYLMVASLLVTFEVPLEAEGFEGGVKINEVPDTLD